MGTLVLKTAPTLEPVTASEAKTHMRVTISDDDTYITTLISVARKHVEHITNRALVSQTWNYYLDNFPYNSRALKMPIGGLSSVTSITYTDADAVDTVWAASNYIVDTKSIPGQIVLGYGLDWPSFVERPVNAVNIEFVAGYGSAASSVPEGIRQAILLLISHWYDNRELVTDLALRRVPETVQALLYPYRIFSFG